jgi:hypothetical protein
VRFPRRGGDTDIPEEIKRPVYCTFCGKSQHEVVVIIAGPKAYICNECVRLCGGIVEGHRKSANWLFERLATEINERDFTLSWVAGHMFRLVAKGELGRDDAVKMLRRAAELNGSILDAGFERIIADAERSH